MSYVGWRCVVIAQVSDYDSDIPFPPVGTEGVVVVDVDRDGDVEVLFDDYPCPGTFPEWFAPVYALSFFKPCEKRVVKIECMITQ